MNHDTPALLERGRDLFNRGDFFEAHEVWEDAWRTETGEPRRLLQGLIQVAAGFLKHQRGQPRGMASLLSAGTEKLRGIDGATYGLDLEALLTEVEDWQQRLAATAAPDPEARGPGAFPLLRCVPTTRL